MIFEPQAKLLFHSARVFRWLNTDYTTPILVEIAPTGYCNAKCSWCFFKEKQGNKKINKEVMLRTIDDLVKIGVNAINWTGGGEPVLHPNFKEFVLYAHKKGLKQGLFTNGYVEIPYQKYFSWIRISLTDKGFKVIKKPKVPFGICVNHIESHTNQDLLYFCLQAKRFGASYCQIRPALIGDYKNQPLLSLPKFLETYNDKNFNIYLTEYKYVESILPKSYNECYGYHFCPSIDWNGKVSVCLYLTLNKKYILGDLNKKSFLEIWKKIPKKIKVTEKCQNCCKNHEINKILYKVKYLKEEDFL